MTSTPHPHPAPGSLRPGTEPGAEPGTQSGTAWLHARGLPGFDELTEADRAAALLHVYRRHWTGCQAAIRDDPPRYVDDPRLVSLDPVTACAHAWHAAGPYDQLEERIGLNQANRLYAVAMRQRQGLA